MEVDDDRALSWDDATESVARGEVGSAEVSSNYACSTDIASDVASVVLSLSSDGPFSSALENVSFTTPDPVRVYYKYVGSGAATPDSTPLKITVTDRASANNAVLTVTGTRGEYLVGDFSWDLLAVGGAGGTSEQRVVTGVMAAGQNALVTGTLLVKRAVSASAATMITNTYTDIRCDESGNFGVGNITYGGQHVWDYVNSRYLDYTTAA